MPELKKKPSGFQRFTNRLFDPGPNVTEQSIQQNNAMADALFAQGSDSRPIQSRAQGVAQLVQALNSQILRKRGEKGEEALKSQRAKELGNVLSNLSLDPKAQELLASLPQGSRDEIIAAIAGRQLNPEKAKPRDAVNFGDLEGNVKLSAIPGTAEFNAAVSDPNLVRIGNVSQVQRQEAGGVDAFDVNNKKINTDAVESANTSAALRRNILATLPEVEANKGSVGVRGAVGLKLGGVATNLLGPEMGNIIANAVAGNDQGKIAQIQTRMTTLRAALRPITVGDSGARQSETERQIAGKAIGFIDEIKGPTDLAAAWPQIQGALKELAVATLENEFEQAAISPAVDFPFDLSNEDGFIELGKMLSDAGFSLEEAIRARDRLIRIQNQ